MDSYSSLIVISSNTIYILLACVLVTGLVFLSEFSVKRCDDIESDENKNKKNRPPGPRRLPIIGNLISLDGYEVPYQAFGDLEKKYGKIISLQLGNVSAVVVNGIKNIREVLIHKTSHFDSRPNFRRYHQLFSGNKENCKFFHF